MATAIEYGLVCALISVVVITAISAINYDIKPVSSHPPPAPQCHFQGITWDAVDRGAGYACRIIDMRWKP